MGVTIKDVAKEAGVSVATTSYALNGTGPVSVEKKKLVKRAAKSLGYVPISAAKSLRARKMGVVGYFSYSLSGPVFSEITKGIEDVFNEHGQDMVACCYSPKAQKLTKFLSERMVDGAIIFDQYIEDELIERISGKDCPIVVMDRRLQGEYISNIVVDNYGSAYEAGRHICQLGFSKVGCILGSGFDGEERKLGFEKAVKDFGLEMPEEWVLKGEFQKEIAYSSVEALAKQGNLPDIFFAFSDEMALGAVQALQQEGCRVPEDISIIGVDDIPMASYVTPKLTTVHRPLYELGRLAAETLYRMVHKKEKGICRVLPTNLVERESCRRYDNGKE